MIHSSAFIDPRARIGNNVSIGPHCCIGPDVVLGDNSVLHNNVTLTGHITIGEGNEFFPGAVIGACPQDVKYKGGRTQVIIGSDNVFREYVTVHAGTEVGGGLTRIGSHNRFLVGVHIAHDVQIADDCILSNYVQLAGHVCLEDKVTMGGLIGVHHFTTIGTLAFVGGMSRITNDVPPYMIVEGHAAEVRGFNRRGMERWGFTEDQIRGIREAYSLLFSQRAERGGHGMLERLALLEARADLNGEVRQLCESIRRSCRDGVFGRYLERLREDTDADRQDFYGRNSAEPAT